MKRKAMLFVGLGVVASLLALLPGLKRWTARPATTAGRTEPDVRAVGGCGALDLEVGDQFCRPDGHPWSTQPGRTMVIVTSATCPACLSNRAFEDLLRRRCAQTGTPLLYMFKQSPEQQTRVAELKSMGQEVLQTDLSALGFSRTPTIAAVDGRGVILAMSMGTVSPERQNEVLSDLTSGAGVEPYERINRPEFERRASRLAAPQVLALRESAALPSRGIKYRMMPSSEISARAAYELHPDVATLVDCGTALSPWDCQEALLTLKALRFRNLIAVDLPSRPPPLGCGADLGTKER